LELGTWLYINVKARSQRKLKILAFENPERNYGALPYNRRLVANFGLGDFPTPRHENHEAVQHGP
jgi:hypothetical protein